MKFNKIILWSVVMSALTITSVSAQVQDTLNVKKIKEYGFGLYNLNSFSLQYRIGTEKKLIRLMGNISSTSSQTINTQNYKGYNPNYAKSKTPINMNIGFNISFLKLKNKTEKFGFQIGPEFGLGYNIIKNNNQSEFDSNNNSNLIQINTESTTNSYSIHLGYVLGFYYKLNSSLFLIGEVSPNIYYIYSSIKTNNNEVYTSKINDYTSNIKEHQFQLSNLSNSNAMISLVYRLNK